MIEISRIEAITLMRNNGLFTGQIYEIQDATSSHIKIGLQAIDSNTFSVHPFLRTSLGHEFDSEKYLIAEDKLICTDSISCVVKCTNGVWNMITNPTHQPQHVQQVTSGDGQFTVNFTKTYTVVNSSSTSIDETYSESQLGVTCGASVGLNLTIVKLHKSVVDNGTFRKVKLSNAEASIPGSNIWFSAQCSKVF